ncbi:hypothetical protein [Xylella fastidiosa]|uniref:hypothetical protein n=1 Tax=Xylella fastidiosa TaxID=2371 RepID=UPI0013967A39|nr:hypothetical protein [Xylella fastidiosa]
MRDSSMGSGLVAVIGTLVLRLGGNGESVKDGRWLFLGCCVGAEGGTVDLR